MPSPLCARSLRLSSCVNRSKISGSTLRGDADAVVAHAKLHLIALVVDAQADVAAAVGVLGRIAEHVAERLGEAQQVTEQQQRLGGGLHRQLVPAFVDERRDGLDGARDEGRDLDRLARQR